MIKFKNKYFKVPLLYSGSGGSLLPPELQACEYLISDANSYIKLPFSPPLFEYIKGKVEYNTSSTDILAFGSNLNTNHLQLYYTGGEWVIRYFCENRNTITTNINNLIAEFEFNDTNLHINGIDIQINYTLDKHVSDSIVIFGQISNNNIVDTTNLLKWYYFESNLFSLLSCYVKSGQTYTDNKGITCPAGTPGMYDTVNGIFFTNDGTGNFTCGPDII